MLRAPKRRVARPPRGAPSSAEVAPTPQQLWSPTGVAAYGPAPLLRQSPVAPDVAALAGSLGELPSPSDTLSGGSGERFHSCLSPFDRLRSGGWAGHPLARHRAQFPQRRLLRPVWAVLFRATRKVHAKRRPGAPAQAECSLACSRAAARAHKKSRPGPLRRGGGAAEHRPTHPLPAARVPRLPGRWYLYVHITRVGRRSSCPYQTRATRCRSRHVTRRTGVVWRTTPTPWLSPRAFPTRPKPASTSSSL